MLNNVSDVDEVSGLSVDELRVISEGSVFELRGAWANETIWTDDGGSF